MSYWQEEIIHHGETLEVYICLMSAKILLLKQSFKWKKQKSKAVFLKMLLVMAKVQLFLKKKKILR